MCTILFHLPPIQAYRKGLYGKYYRWIVFGWYDSEWWRETDLVDTFDCSIDEMDAVIEGSIAIQQYPINEAVNKPVIGNIVSTFILAYWIMNIFYIIYVNLHKNTCGL